MRVMLGLALVLGTAIGGAAGANDGAILRAALDAAEARDYDGARAAARRAGDPLVGELADWRRFLRGDAPFDEMQAHLARRPDWAGRALIREEAERAMPPGLPRADVERFFAEAPPQTGSGAIRLAEARGDAAPIDRAWRELPLTQSEREAIEARWPSIAREGAVARLDEMLWRGEEAQARAILPLVPPGWRALAEARLALRARKPGVDALIAAVPAALANDPGLAYERFVWRDRADREADAVALLAERSVSAEALGRPDHWAARRHGAARRAMREGRAAEAYRYAAAHHLTAGGDYAQLEWLAGWIALRGLGDPDRAAGHFLRMWHAVETPISLGRAGYWLGRAYEAAGDPRRATEWYARAADHPTSFYGQLAAEKIGLNAAPILAARDGAEGWSGEPFAASGVPDAARLLVAADQGLRARWFLTSLGATLETRADFAAAGALALALGRPDAAVRIGKTAAAAGHVIMDIYYPVTALSEVSAPIEPALAKAIARQESELNPEAVSPAGARGVMQLMPATAERVARDLGLRYDRGRLTADPVYNARLGTAYMAQMLERYDGATILAAAAYNAGPHRVDRWLVENGDPRRGVDPIDWIENIPFNETRNYVQRVMEGLHVYRARLGAAAIDSPLAALTRPGA
jgi:soluble lytic murein transglycosylase